MSLAITGLVWASTRQDGTTLVVLLALADHANDDGWSWPSVATLAAKARVGERSVQKSLRVLAAAGEVLIEEGRGRGVVSRYRVTVGKGERIDTLSEQAKVNADSPLPVEKVNGSTPYTEEKVNNRAEKVNFCSPPLTSNSGLPGVVVEPSREPETLRRRGAANKSQPKLLEVAADPPREFAELHAELLGLPGYLPRASFWETMTRKYAAAKLDWQEQGVKMRGWMDANPRRQCSTAFVLGWIERETERRATRESANGIARSGAQGHGGPRRLAPASAFIGIDSG